MEAKWLEDFLALAETKSFSRAAKSRHLTQSAFSRRIVALEEWMKTKLFDRSVQPVTLTAAGRMFRSLAEDILRSMYAARNLVGDFEEFDENDRAVHFAVAHTLVFTLFPVWLKHLNEQFGNFLTRVEAVNVPEGIQHLMSGECDLLIAYHHPQLPVVLDSDHFPFLTLGIDRLIPVSAVDTDGAPLFELPGKKGKPLPLLAYSSGAFLGNVVEMLLLNAAEPYNLFRCFETHMSEALKGMALAGHGISWLPESCIASDLRKGALVQAGSDRWAAQLEVRLYRSGKKRGEAAERIWAHLTDSSQHSEPSSPETIPIDSKSHLPHAPLI